jgi:transcriptional regulator with XRE-family HTH domain
MNAKSKRSTTTALFDERQILSRPMYWVETMRLMLVSLIDSVHNVSRKELAGKLGISKAAVSTFLNGSSDFRLSSFVRLVVVMGHVPIFHFAKLDDYLQAKKRGADPYRIRELSLQDMLRMYEPAASAAKTIVLSGSEQVGEEMIACQYGRSESPNPNPLYGANDMHEMLMPSQEYMRFSNMSQVRHPSN